MQAQSWITVPSWVIILLLLQLPWKARHQTAVAKRTATMTFKVFRTQYCGIISFGFHTRPHDETCPIVFTHMCNVVRIANWNAQGAFNRNLQGTSPSLNYGARYFVESNKTFLFIFSPCHNNIYFATNVINDAVIPPYPLRRRYCSLNNPASNFDQGKIL